MTVSRPLSQPQGPQGTAVSADLLLSFYYYFRILGILHDFVESSPFFVSLTSSCSISSWFTSSCAHHLITVTTFALTICHSLGLLLQTYSLKLICFINPFLYSLSGSFQTAFTDLEPAPDQIGTDVCLSLFFLLFCFWLRVLTTPSFLVHAKLFYCNLRILDYC